MNRLLAAVVEHPVAQRLRRRGGPEVGEAVDPGPVEAITVVSASEFSAPHGPLLLAYVASQAGIHWGLWRADDSACALIAGMYPTSEGVHGILAGLGVELLGDRQFTSDQYVELASRLKFDSATWTRSAVIGFAGHFRSSDI